MEEILQVGADIMKIAKEATKPPKRSTKPCQGASFSVSVPTRFYAPQPFAAVSFQSIDLFFPRC